jgi:hypothetical protein
MSYDAIHLPGYISAVVLYENLETGKRAQQVFQQLGHLLQCCPNWNTSYWILNLLAIPSVQSLVAQEVSQADVIVLALQDESELPTTVSTCLQSSLAKATQPKALVALLGFCTEYKRDVSPVKIQLESLAAKAQKTCWILRTDISSRMGEEPPYESEELMRTMEACTGWGKTNALDVIPDHCWSG